MSEKPVLTYFDIRGRAEPTRLLLEEMGADYTDDRLPHGESGLVAWLELKPKTPFGQLPVWREGDLELAQGYAILRHVARVHGLDGLDEKERARCDVAQEAVAELRDLFGSFFWRPDCDAQRDAFAKDELLPRLEQLERYLQTNPAGPEYFAGSSITSADLMAFSHLDDVQAVFPETLERVPALRALWQRIGERPRIRAYVKSRRSPAIQSVPKGERLMDPR